MAVVDDHQGKGVGSMLLRALVAAAQENGIHTFRGWVLGDNAEILRPLERIGARRKPDQGVLRVEVDLDAVYDGSSIRKRRAVAAGELNRARQVEEVGPFPPRRGSTRRGGGACGGLRNSQFAIRQNASGGRNAI